MTTKIASQGEIVICPQCQKDIAEITQDLDIGMIIHASLFKKIGSTDIVNQTIPICADCGALWIVAPKNSLLIKNKGMVP